MRQSNEHLAPARKNESGSPTGRSDSNQHFESFKTWVGFPKLGELFLMVSITRMITYYGLFRGSLILGNYYYQLPLGRPESAVERWNEVVAHKKKAS